MTRRRLSWSHAAACLVAPLILAASAAAAAPTPSPLARATGQEVLVRWPVTALAADGDAVAFVFCNQLVEVWRPGSRTLTPLGQPPLECPPQVAPQTVLGLAVAGRRVGWTIDTGGNTVDDLVLAADLGRPEAVTTVAHVVHCCRADPKDLPDQDRLGAVFGRGNLLAFSSRRKCGDVGAPACAAGAKPTVVSETIWRIVGAPARARCLGAPGPCTRLTAVDPTLELVAADAAHLVFRRPDGALLVANAAGRVVRTFAPGVWTATGVALAGDAVVAFVPGAVRVLDLASGRVRETRIPEGDPRLVDASYGLVAYLLAGRLHLLRLRDGADRAVAAASGARFAAGGLVYVFAGVSPWPGRIRFLPWNALPLRT